MEGSHVTRVRTLVLAVIAGTLLAACGPAPPRPAREVRVADSTEYRVEEVAQAGTVAGVATLDVPPVLRPAAGAAHDQGAAHAIPPETRRASGLGGFLPDAVVYLADIRSGRGFDGRAPAPRLNQRAMQFEPRVQLVRPGATLEVLNSDPTSHTVRGIHDETRETLFNYAMPLQDQRLHVAFERPGRVSVLCDMTHGWMKATVVVMRHPYYAVTDADGRFELTGVPPGEYELRAWHDVFGEKSLQVRVAPSSVARVTFSFSLS